MTDEGGDMDCGVYGWTDSAARGDGFGCGDGDYSLHCVGIFGRGGCGQDELTDGGDSDGNGGSPRRGYDIPSGNEDDGAEAADGGTSRTPLMASDAGWA